MKQRHKFVPLNRVIIAGHCTHDTQMRLTAYSGREQGVNPGQGEH